MTSDPIPHSGPVARNLTEDEWAERQQVARELDGVIRRDVRAGAEALWHLAQDLWKFDEAGGWSALGFESLGAWLEQPGIDLSTQTYYRFVQTYREARARGITSASTKDLPSLTKLYRALPAITQGVATMDEAVEDARTMSDRAMREKYACLTEQKKRASEAAAPEPAVASTRPPDAAPEPAPESPPLTLVPDPLPVCRYCGYTIADHAMGNAYRDGRKCPEFVEQEAEQDTFDPLVEEAIEAVGALIEEGEPAGGLVTVPFPTLKIFYEWSTNGGAR